MIPTAWQAVRRRLFHVGGRGGGGARVLRPTCRRLFSLKNGVSAIKNDRDIAKKANTLEVILRAEITEMHKSAFSVLKKYIDDRTKTIAVLAVGRAHLEKDDDRKDAEKIYEILNWYEYLAVGIRRNILSEEILRNACFTTMIELWSDSKLFVVCVRDRVGNANFCEAFERLVIRWEQAGYDGTLPPKRNII
ncbi:MAG: DUF4760 domain-containing protein [Proteobacteria bacterium]|nr:DUF4760 domain-containing protein [Pseudomonadota bacterium]